MRRIILEFLTRLAIGLLMSIAPMQTQAQKTTPSPRDQVWAVEQAFAKSMADRDQKAFAEHLSEEAVFFGQTMLRGKVQVLAGWANFFVGKEAPFSWEPDQVEVLPSGTLALSTGPVKDPSGKVIARFNSVWRLEASGRWRIVFDKGSQPD